MFCSKLLGSFAYILYALFYVCCALSAPLFILSCVPSYFINSASFCLVLVNKPFLYSILLVYAVGNLSFHSLLLSVDRVPYAIFCRLMQTFFCSRQAISPTAPSFSTIPTHTLIPYQTHNSCAQIPLVFIQICSRNPPPPFASFSTLSFPLHIG